MHGGGDLSTILGVYRLLLLLVFVGGAPYWLARMALSRRYRAGILGRLGVVPARVGQIGSGREVVWLHAVSVGEVIAATELVRLFEEAGCAVALSTTTRAGQELARRRFPAMVVFYMPLDVAWILRRYLRALRPRLVVTMESELWPNLIHTCAVSRIPLAVANARISDRSFLRYLRLRALWRPLLREVSLFLAQSEATERRLVRMGVAPERVLVTGNMKYDGAGLGAGNEPTALTRAVRALTRSRMIVAGSTLAGEEEVLLTAFAAVRERVRDVVLLLAPRHPQRFAEVLGLAQRSGMAFVPCSALVAGGEPVRAGTVLVLDTIGDLASMYSLAAVAFVGGSLVPKGGHNPLEPARFGVPVTIGESYENFREIVDALRAADAIRIVRGEELAGTLVTLLEDEAEAHAMGVRGQRVFTERAGATERTVVPLLALMRRAG